MMRIKFLTGMADAFGNGFNPGEVVDMPDDAAKGILKMVRGDDAEPVAILIGAQVCPKCGHTLQEPTGHSAPELEAAAVSHAPRRRG